MISLNLKIRNRLLKLDALINRVAFLEKKHFVVCTALLIKDKKGIRRRHRTELPY